MNRLQGAAVAAIAVLGWTATAAHASAKPEIDDRFNARTSVSKREAIPGDGWYGRPGGTPVQMSNRILMNEDGGGVTKVKGDRRSSYKCNLPEKLAVAIWSSYPGCDSIGSYRVELFDQSVFPRRVLPPQVVNMFQAPYGRLGPKADELESLEQVHDVVAAYGARRQADLPRLDSIPAQFEATAALMGNVITPRKTRRLLVQNLAAVSGSAPRTGVTDPRGRPASLIEVPDSSRAGVITLEKGGEVRQYDLTDAAQMTLQLYFDPETFAPLTQRMILDSSTVPDLQAFVDAHSPGEASLRTTFFGPVRTVRAFRLAQYRVPCSRVEDASPRDNFCVEFGRPGGKSVSIRVEGGVTQPNRRAAAIVARGAGPVSPDALP